MSKLMFYNCESAASQASCCGYISKLIRDNPYNEALDEKSFNLVKTNTSGELFPNLEDSEKEMLARELAKFGAVVKITN